VTTPLDKTPPFICRLMARNDRRTAPLSVREISQRSGLHQRQVKRLSNLHSWQTVRVDVAFRFASACGVNLLRPRVAGRKLDWTPRLATHQRALERWLDSITA